jgi:hypothetical protein
MNTDMVTLDTVRKLAARDERQQAAVLGLGAAILQTQLVIAAALMAQEGGQGPIVIRRR